MPIRERSYDFLPADHPYPPVSEGRYGTRPITFRDTGEQARIVTVDGKPSGVEPSRAALEDYASEYRLEIVSREFVRDVMLDAQRWRRLPRWVRRVYAR